MSVNKGIMSSNSNEWATPKWLFKILNNIYRFTLDPCSTDENAKCKTHFTKKENGLLLCWNTHNVFMNPPYGREIGKWVEKIFLDACNDPWRVKVALLPARTDTKWFHDYIYNSAKIYFIRGRLKFNDEKGSAPFPSMIVIWNSSSKDFNALVDQMNATYKNQKEKGQEIAEECDYPYCKDCESDYAFCPYHPHNPNNTNKEETVNGCAAPIA